jgi:hypothetical protein
LRGSAKAPARGLVCSAKRRSYRRCRFKVRILTRWRLTMARAEAYIEPLDAPPPWRDDASAKPLTVYTVNHPASPVAMSDVRASAAPVYRRRGRQAPGCLTSESEERETWTAESLRAASSNGEGFGFFLKGRGHGRDFGGRRFRSTLWTTCEARASQETKVGPRQTL